MHCPDTAANKVHLCDIIDMWQQHNARLPPEKRLILVEENVPKDQEESSIDSSRGVSGGEKYQ